MLRDSTMHRPCSRSSYSAALLDSLKSSCRTYLSCSPLGDISRTPAHAPSSISDPSK